MALSLGMLSKVAREKAVSSQISDMVGLCRGRQAETLRRGVWVVLAQCALIAARRTLVDEGSAGVTC